VYQLKKFTLLTLLSTLCLLFSFGCCAGIKIKPPETQQNLITHLNRSTIMFVEIDPWGTKSFCGGVWINESSFVTAKHCISNDEGKSKVGDEFKFQTHHEFDGHYPVNSNSKIYKAKVIAFGTDIDIAILKTEDEINHGIAKLYKKNIRQGLRIHTMSHPVRMSYNYTQGIVSQIRDMEVFPSGNEGRFFVLHVTTSATNGSSGSGLFDDKGELLGIASFISRAMPGAMFYIHRDLVVEVLEENSIPYY